MYGPSQARPQRNCSSAPVRLSRSRERSRTWRRCCRTRFAAVPERSPGYMRATPARWSESTPRTSWPSHEGA